MIIPRKHQNSRLEELVHTPRWLPWRWKQYKNGEWKKPPIDTRTHRHAKWTKPEAWRSFDEAVRYARDRGLDGVGFVTVPDDKWVCIDFDDCRNLDTGDSKLGVDERIAGLRSYTEISPSGEGYKTWVLAVKPGTECKNRKDKPTPWGGNLEMYGGGDNAPHFLTVTFDPLPGYDLPITEAQNALDELYGDYLERDKPKPVARVVAASKTVLSDDEVPEKARNCHKTGGKIRMLSDTHDAAWYPSRSEADQALCDLLAYWCGRDREQIKRVFKTTERALGRYAEDGERYLDRTVDKAIRTCEAVYEPDYGDKMKAKVREHVGMFRNAVRESNLSERKKLVMGAMLDEAGPNRWGRYLKSGRVRFNANQMYIGEVTGIPQRSVSYTIKSLMKDGWVVRKGKYRKPGSGKPGKSYSYELPRELPIVATRYIDRVVEDTPPVRLPSSNIQQSDTGNRVIDPPLIESAEEVYAPTLKARPPTKLHPQTCLCGECLDKVVLPWARPVTYRDGASGKAVAESRKIGAA